ncbi:MAG TPA: ECF transporter S component [Anaerolineae bacterium]|nr:ECF transporter S component [Anaerolineae bacterium]
MTAKNPLSHWLGDVLFIAVQLVGLAAFVYPFVYPQAAAGEATARAGDAPLILGVMLVALFALLGALRIDAKRIAVLGVLCAINAVLRLAETIVLPLPGGFSPVFLLIILVGYAYGARFGFLFGAFSLLVSALVTAGVGPWLPFEMFGAGWVGLTAGMLGKLRMKNGEWRKGNSQFSILHSPFDLLLLLPFGFLWGFLYGALLNLYFWPIVDAGAGLSWQAGLGLGATLGRYAAFYAATSLWWDVASALGNTALLAWLGLPILRALRRFGARFRFEVEPVFEAAPETRFL